MYVEPNDNETETRFFRLKCPMMCKGKMFWWLLVYRSYNSRSLIWVPERQLFLLCAHCVSKDSSVRNWPSSLFFACSTFHWMCLQVANTCEHHLHIRGQPTPWSCREPEEYKHEDSTSKGTVLAIRHNANVFIDFHDQTSNLEAVSFAMFTVSLTSSILRDIPWRCLYEQKQASTGDFVIKVNFPTAKKKEEQSFTWQNFSFDQLLKRVTSALSNWMKCYLVWAVFFQNGMFTWSSFILFGLSNWLKLEY